MPENIDNLLSDLGVDTSASQDAPADTADTSEQVNATTETDNTTDAADNTANTETSDKASDDDEDVAAELAADNELQSQIDNQRANQAFAAMRAENSKYKKFLQTLMKGSNFEGNEEAFIQALENEAYKKQAQIQGIAANPELLRKMDQQEEQIRELTKSQRDQTLLLGLKTLQQTNNLTGKEVEAFVQKAIENKIDLLAPGVNFNTLYKGMFFDDIVTKRIEDERQKWIKQSNKADSAAVPDGKSGKKEPTPTDVKTMAEFDSLLNTVSKELK